MGCISLEGCSIYFGCYSFMFIEMSSVRMKRFPCLENRNVFWFFVCCGSFVLLWPGEGNCCPAIVLKPLLVRKKRYKMSVSLDIDVCNCTFHKDLARSEARKWAGKLRFQLGIHDNAKGWLHVHDGPLPLTVANNLKENSREDLEEDDFPHVVPSKSNLKLYKDYVLTCKFLEEERNKFWVVKDGFFLRIR